MNKTTSKTFLSLAAIAVIAFGTYTAVGAFAHGVGGMGTSGYHGMMGSSMMGSQHGQFNHQGMMGSTMMGATGTHMTDPATTTQYLDTLKGQLKITSQQENAWKQFAQTVTEQSTTHDDLIRTMHGSTADSTDLTDQHLQAMGQAIANHQNVSQAFQALYDQFDTNQKSQANQVTSGCPGWGGSNI
ncbi:MAG: Spy/CpxP family protein refolding chaperone [Magnetococcales bacterium]|nr:Spy/CpxP family protein refolding chaperone [Magnetococcales bacterium]